MVEMQEYIMTQESTEKYLVEEVEVLWGKEQDMFQDQVPMEG